MRAGLGRCRVGAWRTGVAAVAIALLCSACQTIRQVMPAAREAQRVQEQMSQLQARVMRYADEYVGRVVEDSARFRETVDDPNARYVIAGWRLSQANSAYAIAAGPSPVVNALDIVTLATLSRRVIEEQLLPRYPEDPGAQRLLETHRELERSAWTICDEFLTQSQVAEFRDVIDEWRRQHPEVASVAFIHFLDFAKQIGRPRPGESAASGGLFAMLGLDPLSGLDPAVREIEQTRQLAERTIYYMQRVPYVLNLQFERVTSELLARPEMRSVIEDSGRITESVERFSRVAAGLPQQISAERAALVAQLSGEMLAHEQSLRPLLGDLRATLEAGDATAQSLDAMVHSLDRLVGRFPAKKPAEGTGAPAARPFDITEYTAAAAEFSRTADQLRELILSLDAQAPALAGGMQSAVERSQTLIDYLFLRAALLIVLLVGAVLAAALAYRKATAPRAP
jgi:hypothetical protein